MNFLPFRLADVRAFGNRLEDELVIRLPWYDCSSSPASFHRRGGEQSRLTQRQNPDCCDGWVGIHRLSDSARSHVEFNLDWCAATLLSLSFGLCERLQHRLQPTLLPELCRQSQNQERPVQILSVLRLQHQSQMAMSLEKQQYVPFRQAIIIGAGLAGLDIACEFKRKLNFHDFVIYDSNPGLGGTWFDNNCKPFHGHPLNKAAHCFDRSRMREYPFAAADPE